MLTDARMEMTTAISGFEKSSKEKNRATKIPQHAKYNWRSLATSTGGTNELVGASCRKNHRMPKPIQGRERIFAIPRIRRTSKSIASKTNIESQAESVGSAGSML